MLGYKHYTIYRIDLSVHVNRTNSMISRRNPFTLNTNKQWHFHFFLRFSVSSTDPKHLNVFLLMMPCLFKNIV